MKRFAIVVYGVIMASIGFMDGYAVESQITAPNTFGLTGFYTLVNPDTAGRGVFSAGIAAELSKTSLPKDPRTPSLFQAGLVAGYSLTDSLELGFMLPYRRLEVSDEGTLAGFDESGLGDILTSLKFRVLAEGDVAPALGLFGTASFPTGDAEKGLGSGTYDFTLGTAIAKQIAPVRFYGNLAFLYSGWNVADPNPLFDTYQHALLYGGGFELPTTDSRIKAFSELSFVHEFGDDDDDAITTFRGQNAQADPLTGLLPDYAVAQDPVDDGGQATFGVRVAVTENLLLTGGASLQILGEAAVPDAPRWRGFMNMSLRFGGTPPTPSPQALAEPELPTAPEEVSTGNRCPVITGISVSDELIRGGEQVRVAVNANDPDGDALYYFWVTYYGTLTGQASQVVWTAPECDALNNFTREYEIQVEVNDGACTVNRIFTISVVCGSGETSETLGGVPENTILFASGSTSLDNIAKAKLDALAAALKQSPETTIILEGHTDATGDENVNQQIGLKRAESVKRYLVQRHGLDANRIITQSQGSQRPVASNETAEGRAQNRRVEVYQEF